MYIFSFTGVVIESPKEGHKGYLRIRALKKVWLILTSNIIIMEKYFAIMFPTISSLKEELLY